MAAKTFATYLSELTEATALGTGDRVPVLESSTVKYVDGAELTPYLKYVALLSQSGTSAPTATVLENTLGGTVVWERNDVGSYTGTLTGAFPADKTFFPAQIAGAGYVRNYITYNTESDHYIRFYNTTDDVLSVFLNDTATDNSVELSDLPGVVINIEIRVYP